MKKVISTIVATAFLASCSTVNKYYDDVTTGETRNEVSNKSSEVTSEVSALLQQTAFSSALLPLLVQQLP